MDSRNNNIVFLSYASEDIDIVLKIHKELIKRDLNVWFDKERLGPGSWYKQIMKAISMSRYFVIFISKSCLRKVGEKPGFQDEELNRAYEIAMSQPEKSFTIVPVRIEDCSRGDNRLSIYQQYDLFKNFEKTLDNLSINLGGKSLSDAHTKDERTEDEKLISSLIGKANASFFAADYERSLIVLDFIISTLKPDMHELFNNKGNSLLHLGRYDEALKAYEQSLAINSNDYGVWNNIGNCFHLLGRYEDAFKSYKRCTKINPNDPESWYNIAIVLDNLGFFDKAIYAYDKAIELKVNHYAAWYNKGNIFYRIGRYEKALISYEKAIEFNPDEPSGWTWYNKGNALDYLGLYDEAIKAYDKAIKINPGRWEAWNNKGTTLINLCRYEEAIKSYDKAIEINPDYTDVWRNKGIAYERMGMQNKADICFKKGLKL